MKKRRIIGAVCYPDLEDAFAEELTRLLGAHSRLWVLVPTNLLALHLRRTAARRLGGVAAVEFLTLKDAARRMALPVLAAEGLRPMPPGADELFLQRCLRQAPEESYFAALGAFRNAAGAVARALQTLTNSGWRPDALRRAARRATFADPSAPDRLGNLADIWEELEEWKSSRGLFTADDLVARASRADRELPDHANGLLIYGFYDFTPAQRALVARLIDGAGACSAFLLWAEEDGEALPGFRYARPTVDWLRERLEVDAVEQRQTPSGEAAADAARLPGGLFRDWPLAGQEEAAPRAGAAQADGTFRIVSCPGEEPEAAEVARRVLVEASADGPGEVGVLLRTAEEAMPLLAETFDRAELRWYGHEGMPLARTLPGRVALALMEAAGGTARRSEIIDFLALAELQWPEGLSAATLERLSREAGSARRPRGWPAALRDHATRLHEEANYAETDADRRALERKAELCATAAGWLEDFLRRIDVFAQGTWARAAQGLAGLVVEFAPEEAPCSNRVREVIENVGTLDVAGVPLRPDAFRWMLRRSLNGTSRASDRFQHAPVTACSIMDLRGVTFDVVIVPGMVEKGFPRQIPEEPILPETDRRPLNQVAGDLDCGPLPLQARRPEEERYLFQIALGSARRGVVLTYPRLDQDRGRPRIPSRFLSDCCSALLGVAVSTAALEEGPAAPWLTRVPLNRRDRAPDGEGPALTEREYDAAEFTAADGLRTGYMAAVSPWFARALQMEEERWGRPVFGAYDGKVRAADLVAALRDKHGAFREPVSPTQLERYAQCPFHYFLRHVLEVEEAEEPPEEALLTPLERGSLIHTLLRELYGQKLAGRPLGRLGDEDIRELLGAARELLSQIGGTHRERRPAAWTAEREQILDCVLNLLRHERSEHAGWVPREFERKVRGGMEVGGSRVHFRGRIDRIDGLAEGAVRIVDYKTGKAGRYRQDSFQGGEQLQMPVYLHCRADEEREEAGAALYLELSGPKDVPEFTIAKLRERMDDFRRALGLILGGVAAGDFFPVPAGGAGYWTYCGAHCPYGQVCGAARGKLAEIKAGDPDLGRLHELREIE